MKTIFLCDKKSNIEKVYAESFDSLPEVERTVYSASDLLTEPTKFEEVEYVFSTWGMPSLTEEQIKSCLPSLKCVFYAAGSVQPFARPFLACGVKVFSAWAANAVPVVEYTLAQIILANKGFFAHSREMKKGNREAGKVMKASYPGNYGENVGIIGVGMIGSQVAERLKDYKLKVLAFDPFLSDERAESLGIKKASLEEIFATCRVVSNHMANNEQTKGMLDYKYFSKMMPYSTFINTGRGAQVVEDDLVRVLTERPDVTAILDVTYPEPPAEGHAFYSLPNCFLTPHIAGSLMNETHRMAEYIIEEYERFISGERCLYEVSEKMLETMA
ncbi:MAG: hydroxyacid dehydrogenase [Clostridia bacterium]|nr:hydroxyacid dehydrogenase [Clostridia bacterium]